ncbi:MAG: hypothetical protein IKX22_05450 [Prevotella sp.]|nr:hypothetical protein [Prevotella sp.]
MPRRGSGIKLLLPVTGDIMHPVIGNMLLHQGTDVTLFVLGHKPGDMLPEGDKPT